MGGEPSLKNWERHCIEDISTKDCLIRDEGVCRTAPGAPGLFPRGDKFFIYMAGTRNSESGGDWDEMKAA